MTLQPPLDSRQGYAHSACERECEIVSRIKAGRNDQLNRSAYALGQLVGAGALDRHEVEGRLFAAAEACGYVSKDGSAAAWSTIRSGLDKGERAPRNIPSRPSSRSAAVAHAASGNNVHRLAPARAAASLGSSTLPDWTPPDAKGKPVFTAIGRDGPERFDGELRRHAYRRGGMVVRVKIKRGPSNWVNLYRVRRPNDGAEGWQAKQPNGFVPTPYFGPAEAYDPFDPEHVGETLFWPEGEKDVDSLQALDLFAFTFGGSRDVPECGELLRGRDLVILADNDADGAKCAQRKFEMARDAARTVRIVDFPELQAKGDVSDWLAAGGTVEALQDRVATAQDALQQRVAPERDALRPESSIEATPFRWIDPSTIEPRGWLYGWHYIRKFVSCTVSPGGVGKSTLAIAEALAIVSGRPLLGLKPVEQAAVWYWNGEDPQDELDRRVMAAATLHGLSPIDIGERLFVDTGRVRPIILAEQTKNGVTIVKPLVEAVKKTIRANRIGLVIIDPFVSSHRVTENDNGAIDAVATVWAQIADETGCAVELIHHSRKTGGAEVTVEDGRGAVALLNKARSARAINSMTEDEAEQVGVENRRLYFRHFPGKSNLAPPSDTSTWIKLESKSLDNARGNRPPDEVGVAVSWEWPTLLKDVDVSDLVAIQKKVHEDRFRADSQSTKWAGKVVAEVLGLDIFDQGARSQIRRMLKLWTKNNMFKVVEGQDSKRNQRKFLEVDQWATS